MCLNVFDVTNYKTYDIWLKEAERYVRRVWDPTRGMADRSVRPLQGVRVSFIPDGIRRLVPGTDRLPG